MVADNFPIENRKFYRHPLNVPIKFEERKSHQGGRTSSLDVSEGGVSFLSARFLAKGTAVTVSIPVGGQIFNIEGRIAYSNRTTSMDFYRTGVSFEDASNLFRVKLVEQMILIKEYREQISNETGESVSEEEAARKWITKFAQNFSELF